jgi:hypothetical protein
MSDRTPAPVGRQATLPHAVRRAQTLWYLSVAMTFFTGLTLFLNRTAVTTYLADLLHSRDPATPTARLADDTQLVVYAGVVLLLFLVVFEGLLTRVLSWPRQWPRLVMVLAFLLHLAIATLCALLIPLSAWQGWLVMASLVAGTVLAAVATVRPFTPAVTRWIRTERAQDRRVDVDGAPGEYPGEYPGEHSGEYSVEQPVDRRTP